jgi:flavodoxin/NAD-dependent dihydropyrimidine dehydrogenase PreA subunit
LKAIIVYFSQTGNTRTIAESIYKGLKKSIKDVVIKKLRDTDPKQLDKYDLIGLGAPVWRFDAPVNVQAFIKKNPSLKGKHAFAFCAHGASPAGFLQNVTASLEKKGATVIGWQDWYGSCFLPFLPEPYLTDGHPDEIDIKEAVEFGKKMADLSTRIFAGETKLIPQRPSDKEWIERYGEGHEIFNNPLGRARAKARDNMKVNMSKCKYPECTICIDNCPMGGAIDFSANPPVFKKSCISDWFCEGICPTGAIEVDYSELAYEHDLIIRDHYFASTGDAEGHGNFRRLVPLDKVGWKSHKYEVKGHPRLKVV